MSTNVESTRPVGQPKDSVRVDPTTNASGVDGVAVYDQGPDAATRSSVRSEASMASDPAPVTTSSTGSMIAWIIGIVILVLLIYFLWQMFF